MECMFSTPAETAQELLNFGKSKGNLSTTNMVLLGILAGVYIALAAQLATIATNDVGAFFGDGITRVVMGLTFTLGLILVVIAGAELWTGNNLMVPAAYTGVISWGQLFKNWVLVYFSNFLGSLIMVGLMAGTGLWQANGGAVGARAWELLWGKFRLALVPLLPGGSFVTCW